jgi:hypothetical protein
MTTEKQLIRRAPARKFNTKYNLIKRPDPDARRTVGFGAPPELTKIKAAASLKEGLGSICDMIASSMACPIWNMPIVEQTRGTLLGPASDQTVSQFFGAEIRPFDWTNSTTGFDYVETTMAQSGELQCHTLAMAVGWHVEIEQQMWTADGNAATIPETGTPAFPSPDYFTKNDVVNGCLDAPPTFVFSGDAPNATITPAYLEWGWWAAQVAWFMVRGYDLQWKIGQHTNIMDEVLRHTAYMPTNAQEGSASSSEVDIARFVARVNERYEQLGSGLFFSKVDRIRIGSVGGTPTTNLGIFRPSRDHQRVGVTYGGGDLRSMLKGNSEFRQLTVPYVIKAGIPIGLLARVNDETQANLMREYLSITQGQGSSIPPLEVDANNLASSGFFDGSGSANVALERTFDAFNVPQQCPFDNAIFKGGELKITLAIKGFEVTDDWYTMCQNNPDLREAIMSETGCCWAKQSS